MIEVRELTKSFGGHVAISGVSFVAPNGAITGLLGANGAGKTTTLKSIAGVLRPTEGQVTIDGTSSILESELAQSRLGVLLDHTGLYPRLTSRENLQYFAALRGLNAADTEERISKLVQVLGLERIIDTQTHAFSQGERMKIALGRALLHSPSNLVLDEPTNGLDIITLRRLREFLRELRDSGMCILFSSHILEEVSALCDVVTVISNGCVAGSGTIQELCELTRCKTLEDAFVALQASTEITHA